LIFVTRIPRPPLANLVEMLAYNEGYCPSYAKEVILPDGGIDLIIDLTPRPKNIYDNDRLHAVQTCYDGWISGMRNERITIDSGKNLSPRMVVIRFRPGGARPFFKFPMNELANIVVDLEQVWGRPFRDLRDQLGETTSPMEVLEKLERALIDWAGNNLEPHHCMDHAATMIAKMKKPLTMKQLTRHIGYSHKHFIKLFETHIGVSPKRYSRIMRFQAMVRELEMGVPPSWSQFAQTFGFYDQAHFNNEFRAFAGMTPTRYLQSRGEYMNYLPANEG